MALTDNLNIPQTSDDIRLPGLLEGQVQQTIPCNGKDLRISTSNPAGFTVTRDIAQKQVNFSIKMPAYLPTGYCGINHFDVYADQQAVAWPVWSQTGMLTVAQVPADSPASTKFGLNTVGTAPAAQVAVNGYEGLWIEGAPSGTGWFYQKPVLNPSASAPNVEENVHIVPENILTWEQDGVRYQLRGNLDYYQMQQIAMSLQ